MRVCIFSQYFPPDTGGASTRSWNVAESLRKLGHTVIVVTAFPHYPRGIIPSRYRGKAISVESGNGMKVVRVWVPGLPHEGVVKRLVMYLAFSFSSLMAVPFARKCNVTWAMSPNYLCVIPAVACKLINGSRVIHDVVDIWPGALTATGYSFPRSIVRVVRSISQLSYVVSDLVTTISDSMRTSLARKVPSSVKIAVVENCVTPDFFQVGRKQELSEFRIMYLGTLAPSNDFSVILEAARKLRHDNRIRFVIAGSGELGQSIRASISADQIGNVELHDKPIQHDIVPNWLSMADVLILPLRSGFGNTSFPSKFGEYLATGRPVICMADGIFARDVKSGDFAIIVAPSDTVGLVEAISQLVNDKTLYNSLSSRGREYARVRMSMGIFEEKVDKVLQLATDNPVKDELNS